MAIAGNTPGGGPASYGVEVHDKKQNVAAIDQAADDRRAKSQARQTLYFDTTATFTSVSACA